MADLARGEPRQDRQGGGGRHHQGVDRERSQDIQRRSAHDREQSRSARGDARLTDDRETAVWLVEVVADVVREPGRVEGFGAIGQQYFNLRKSGLSERDALDDLSRRYRSRG